MDKVTNGFISAAKKAVLALVLVILTQLSFAQKTDSTTRTGNFSGSVSITNNGISLVPTFSLGDPAAIVLLSVGKRRLTFEPDLRFALEGKPWSFLFWWRYKVISTGKFRLTAGAHPAINFRTFRLPVNGDSANVIIARRFLAGELVPNYQFSKNISIGIYYLYSRGFDINTPKNSHFLTVNSHISNINLPGKLRMGFTPQFYYLKQDKRDGFYFTSSVTLSKKDFPFSVSSILNKTISGNITGSKDFVWNLSLTYAFNNSYARH